jgi:hypothetical protein
MTGKSVNGWRGVHVGLYKIAYARVRYGLENDWDEKMDKRIQRELEESGSDETEDGGEESGGGGKGGEGAGGVAVGGGGLRGGGVLQGMGGRFAREGDDKGQLSCFEGVEE